MMHRGYLWIPYGINHKPLKNYKELFAFTRKEAEAKFKHEYGNDSSILYLVGNTFNQWEN